MLVQAIEQFGGPEQFKLQQWPKPEPGPGSVLVRVRATSVNPADYKIRRYGPPFAPALPAVLGMDVAGVIEAVGSGVSAFKPGDEVYGCAGGVKGLGGTLAQYLLTDPALLALKPESLGFQEAAALPLVTITAWEALFDRAQIAPGQNMLIHAGTGGVGHIGVQLARWRGAKVFTTISSLAKAEIARSLGADVAINYREQSVEEYVAQHTGGRGFDVVFDTIGGDNLDRSFAAARLNGTVVSISTNRNHDLSPMHAKGLTLHAVFMLIQMIHNLNRQHHGEILTQVAALVDAGKLRPLIDAQRFSLAEIALAHSYLESGRATGKVVVAVP